MGWTGFNWDGREYPRILADVTGDGRPDIVGFGLDGVWTARSDGQGGFGAPQRGLDNLGYNQGWRVDQHPRAVAELGGVHLHPPILGWHAFPVGPIHPPLGGAALGADLIGFGDAGVWTALAKGDGSFNPAQFVLAGFGKDQGWRGDRHVRGLADLTGDGRADVVGFGDDGVWTALSAGVGAFAAAQFVLQDLGYNQGWRVEQHPRMAADLTGDRRADVVGFGNDGVWVALNNGAGGFGAATFALADLGYNQGWRVDKHLRLALDLTGDGRADLIGFGDAGVWTARNNGDGSFAAPQFVLADFGFDQGWRVDKHVRLLADVTGDGRPDIVGFGDAGVYVALNDGAGGFAAPQFVIADFGVDHGWRVDVHPRVLADLTGDGRADIVGFGDAGVWTARSNGDGTFGAPQFVLADFGAQSVSAGVKHVFVLMLENRSFDHLLGFSGIAGTDAVTGQPTTIDGLAGTESNVCGAKTYTVQTGAPDVMQAGPGHEFEDVFRQLTGEDCDLVYHGGPYPDESRINNAGFVASYQGPATGKEDEGDVMKGFGKGELPVLQALAEEFAVCDRWFCSLPGPTWPNRLFVHAASSGYLDNSPGDLDTVVDLFGPGQGFELGNGTIYDALDRAHMEYRIYAGDHTPMVASLKNVSILSVREFYEEFRDDLAKDDFKQVRYVHIEPSYDATNDFKDGSSQHPLGSVRRGEVFIKDVYEAIRNSPVWNDSLLIITYDEHGGFYDHVKPPAAQPPNDPKPEDDHNSKGFTFDRYGPRVPAVIVSPRIPRNVVDHRVYDHASAPATIERLFGLKPLTDRDATANAPLSLLTLSAPRTDAPVSVGGSMAHLAPAAAAPTMPSPPADPARPVTEGSITAFLSSAVAQDLEISGPEQREAVAARAKAVKTYGQAQAYIADVAERSKAYRAAAKAAPAAPALPA